MSSKAKARKQARYCRILQWVEDHDAALAGAVEALCFHGAFNGVPSGRTFIYPGAKAAAEIVEAAYGEDPEAAIAMLKGCLIPRYCATAAEAQAAGGLHGFKFAGAKFKASDFVARADPKTNQAYLAVYLSDGVPPHGAEEYRPAPVAREARAARGGAEGAFASMRFKMAAEAAYRFLQAGAADGAYAVYARRVLAIKAACDRARIADKFMMGLDWDPLVAFYLLVEPHKEGSANLLPDEVIDDAAKTPCAHEDLAGAYKDLFSAGGASAGGALRASLDTAPRAMIDQIARAYDGEALWRDEFRSWVGQVKAGLATPRDWVNFFNHAIPENWSGNDREAELTFCSTKKLSATVAARDLLMATLRFVYSTDFCYAPSLELATIAPGSPRLDAELSIWNRSHAAAAIVAALPAEQFPTIAGVTPDVARALQAAYAANPPELVWRAIVKAASAAQ